MNLEYKHLNIRVIGKVQGVAFRYAARSAALSLEIKGYIKNHPDGSVYIEAEGEVSRLESFVQWCRTGPSRARVDHLTIIESTSRGYTDFEIRF